MSEKKPIKIGMQLVSMGCAAEKFKIRMRLGESADSTFVTELQKRGIKPVLHLDGVPIFDCADLERMCVVMEAEINGRMMQAERAAWKPPRCHN